MFRESQQIGLYTLIRRLGRGGFGEVWLAERKSKFVTTKVAVKLPLDEQVDHKAIKHEATLWEQASGHANVLPIIDADIYDGQVVIVSEYADGGSLADRLKTYGACPIKLAVEITIGILKGLEFLHQKQIIHRDIKPQNILLQGDTPRLADFGISRAIQTSSISSSTIVGTDAYMSPESFSGKRNIQTDIWSVGVVFYQLLKGVLPFPQAHPSERMYAILQNDFEPLPANVPRSLKLIIAKALAKLPENRYKTASEMCEDLRRALNGTPLSTKVTSETETVVKPTSLPKIEQPQVISPQPDLPENQSALAGFVESKTPQKTQPKHPSLKRFVMLFIAASFLAGILVLLLNRTYFENYLTTNNSLPNNYSYPTNSIQPNIERPNKKPTNSRTSNKNSINPMNSAANVMMNSNMINSATNTRKSTMMNSNVIYEDTNASGNYYINQDSEQQDSVIKERATIAVQSLENSMLQIAQKVSRSRHQSSNLQGCYSSESDFTMISKTQYYRIYKCRMKGNILGVRAFEVGIKFRSEIVRQENDFIGRILNSEILYDKEL